MDLMETLLEMQQMHLMMEMLVFNSAKPVPNAVHLCAHVSRCWTD
jgi:hypothetical protein